jgi:cyclophilin family peptidyl-prolyl cis-trans isomerase
MNRSTNLVALPLVSLIVMLAVVLAACGDDGGSDDEQSVTEPSPVATEPEPTAEVADENETNEGNQQLPQPEMQWDSPPEMQLEDGASYEAVLTTNKGEIVVNLLESDAPVTVNNFVFLAEQGYYSDVPFHRVITGFMIQTGDPTGTGAGGPGYRFNDEPVTRDYLPGTVAMANAGPNTNGSQFFIVHADLTGRLPKDYTIFGEVTSGMEVVDAIANVPVGRSRSGEMSNPQEEVKIESVEIRSSN